MKASALKSLKDLKSVKQELDGGRSAVFANEHRRMIGAVAELRLVRVLAAGSAERFDARLAKRPSDPPIGRTEAELRKIGGFFDGVDRRQQCRRVHAVARLARLAYGRKNFSHGLSSIGRHHGGSHL